MNKKIIIYLLGIVLLMPIVLAQTGLFSSGGVSSFVNFGVTIVILFVVFKTLGKQFLNRKK